MLRLYFSLPSLGDPHHAVGAHGGAVVDEGVPLLSVADDGDPQVALAVAHHADHTIPEASLWLQTAPLVVPVHVEGTDLVLVQEQLQHSPLQGRHVGLAFLQIKVGQTLVVEGNT